MTSMRTILPSVLLLILIAASTAESIGFNESNPIRMVPDGLREVEQSFVQILGHSRHVISFARFAHKFGKRYENAEETKLRFSVFKETLNFIRSTNKKGLSFTVGINQFADMTSQEFRKNMLGLAPIFPATLKRSHRLKREALPETGDWIEDDFVSPVTDQGGCGSC
ncbi:hypothetical protein HA466_0006190 [Hirschfeldia incana]|nr:hypothetical protein HA466_0006190 [Hirschfeldia incana]